MLEWKAEYYLFDYKVKLYLWYFNRMYVLQKAYFALTRNFANETILKNIKLKGTVWYSELREYLLNKNEAIRVCMFVLWVWYFSLVSTSTRQILRSCWEKWLGRRAKISNLALNCFSFVERANSRKAKKRIDERPRLYGFHRNRLYALQQPTFYYLFFISVLALLLLIFLLFGYLFICIFSSQTLERPNTYTR